MGICIIYSYLKLEIQPQFEKQVKKLFCPQAEGIYFNSDGLSFLGFWKYTQSSIKCSCEFFKHHQHVLSSVT